MEFSGLQILDGTSYPPAGICIYCGATEKLTKEHIIPFALNGAATIPASSCTEVCMAQLLWRPPPEGWEMDPGLRGQPAPAMQIPREVLRHRAILTAPDGTPFSMVVETYTAEVLGFPEPHR